MGYSSQTPPPQPPHPERALESKDRCSTDSYTPKMFCSNQIFSTIKECKLSGIIFFDDLMYFEKSTTIIWVLAYTLYQPSLSYAGSLVKDRAKRELGEKRERRREKKRKSTRRLITTSPPPPSLPSFEA